MTYVHNIYWNIMICYLVCLLCLPCYLQDVLKDTWPHGSHCGLTPWSRLLVAILPVLGHITEPQEMHCIDTSLSQAVVSAHSGHWGTGPSPPPSSCVVTPADSLWDFQYCVRFLLLVAFSTWSNENILKFLLHRGQAILSHRLWDYRSHPTTQTGSLAAEHTSHT